jgi:hypothetical protein
MIKQFNDTVILTTQYPEAFLNYVSDASNYWIVPKSNIKFGTLLVNGIDISTYDANTYGYTLKLSATDACIASFHVYTRNVSDFDVSLNFLIFNDQYCVSLNSIDSVNIYNRPTIITNINVFENGETLVDDKISYLILRTTPQLTGNIKLIVDSSNNLYLDTFKISSELSNRKYRKQPISANSVYSNDIKNVFSKVPVGDDLYKNEKEDTLNISSPKTQLYNQYSTIYNYGARILFDELYTQDNGLLAPLWINAELPDYFCLFRMPGVYNSETYDGSSLSNLAVKYLSESDIFKTWSFKTDTPLGTYLNTHLNDIKKYPAPLFLSLTDPSIQNSEVDPNTWYGISVDKGIITGKDEVTYTFNKNIYNLSKLNAFVSQGFMRNKLISSNLINLEFVFDDNDVSLYTMNRYFGLYLTENILYKIAYYSDVSGGNISILSLDGKDSSLFINSLILFNASTGLLRDAYKNRIFVLNDGINLNRITNKNELDISANTIKSYVNKPNQHLFDVKVEKKDINQFITIQLNNNLNPGEQLRIINETQNKIWEIYAINSSINCQTYVSEYQTTGYPIIHQTSFLVSNNNISDQVHEIEIAFDRFKDYEDNIFRSGVRGTNWVSIILNDDACTNDKWSFQRITSQTLNDIKNPSSGFNTSAKESDITFFGRYTPSVSEYTTILYDASYGPINFEFFGNRRSIKIPLFNRKSNHLYNFSNENDAINKFELYTLYQGTDCWYRSIQDFDISLGYTYQYIQDPLSIETKYLIQTESLINVILNRWNAYNIFPLNISLMGINPIKDIDYTIYDMSLGYKSEYFYARENDSSTYKLEIATGTNDTISIRNSYVVEQGTGFIIINGESRPYIPLSVFNTYNYSATIYANTPTVITYNILDGSTNFYSYKNCTEENVSDYYVSNTLLKYSLTAPSIFKWVGIGTDTRNNQFRLILDPSIISSGFTFTARSDSQESTYPVFKYLTPGIRNWQDYVFYDINDTIKYVENNTDYYKTIKDLMIDEPYVDFFSKLIYYNNKIDNIKNRSTLLYYNEYKNSVDTLFLGLSLSITINNIAQSVVNIKNYDKFRFCMISTSSKNRDSRKSIDIIINENTETILIIWYQGNDVLNYSYRNSSYLPGKSLLDASNGCNIDFRGFITGVSENNYSFIKTPFIVNNSALAKRLVNIYDYKSTYDSSIANPYGQLNYNLYDYSSVWNAYTEKNVITSGIFYSPYSFNTFGQKPVYSYFKNPITYGNQVVNYGYEYQSNNNLYKTNTCKTQTFENLLTNNIFCYIIKQNNVYTSNDFSADPIIISINSPRLFNSIYAYNGWFKPKFDNILEFNSNENNDLINIVEKDFTLCNTNVQLYKNIDQLWYNKVVTTVLISDISNNISYANDFNLFKTLWDADYFIKRNSLLVTEYIDGYQCSKEMPAYFGSKLPKFPDKITLDSWSTDTAYYEENDNYYILCFNITKTVTDLFNSNITFLSNWDGLNITGNIINNYIKDTVLEYYMLNDKNKMDIYFYYKPYNTSLIYYTYDSDFTINTKQNFSSDVYLENNEYIYKLQIPKNNNYSYFVSIVLNEK